MNVVWRRSRRDQQMHAFRPEEVAEANRIYLKALCSHVISSAVLEPVVHVAGHWSALLDARTCLAWLLLTQGRFSEARRLAVHAAECAEPTGEASPPAVSVFGSLLLTGATAAGRDGQRAEAAGLLDAAGEAASRLGGVDRNDYETAFGPSQVTMQTVDVHVVTEEFGEALTAARRMPRDAGLPLAARSRRLADLALAHTRLGHDQSAIDTLLTMQQAAPDWSRYQTLPRQVVRELLERERRVRTPRLRELADRFGVTV